MKAFISHTQKADTILCLIIPLPDLHYDMLYGWICSHMYSCPFEFVSLCMCATTYALMIYLVVAWLWSASSQLYRVCHIGTVYPAYGVICLANNICFCCGLSFRNESKNLFCSVDYRFATNPNSALLCGLSPHNLRHQSDIILFARFCLLVCTIHWID